jgi:molybdopterin converting factor small subunit
MLFFALYRDLAGAGEITVDLPPGSTARGAVEALRSRGAGFGRLPADPVVAVNQEYADLETDLHEGDEIALLPPVAGG